MAHYTYLFAVALWPLSAAAGETEAPAFVPHAALEIHPAIFAALARGGDFPLQVVDYSGGNARDVLPRRGTWDAGETGHLKRLKLYLEAPDDVELAFEPDRGARQSGRPVARLDMTLRGPAEAEWWSKLPLQADWGLVGRFNKRVVLTVRARARIVVSGAKTTSPSLSLAFEKLREPDVELNVKGCPPWLDGVFERRFQVWEQVNEHMSRQIADKTRVQLPVLNVPFTGKQVVYREIRPRLKDDVLRLELVVGSQ